MVTRLAPALRDFRSQPPPQEPQGPRRLADAQTLLSAIATFDARFRDRSPEEYTTEVRGYAAALDRTNLELRHLLDGVQRAYADNPRVLNPLGAVLEGARAARTEAARGRAVAELQALPAAPPSTGPVTAAYRDAIHIACPRCDADPGVPCTNSTTGNFKRVPCLGRSRS